MRRPTLAPVVIVLAALAFLFVGYMGAYYAMLERTWGIEIGNMVVFRPQYHIDSGFISGLFEPAHRLDRLVRPARWATISRPQLVPLSEPATHI